MSETVVGIKSPSSQEVLSIIPEEKVIAKANETINLFRIFYSLLRDKLDEKCKTQKAYLKLYFSKQQGNNEYLSSRNINLDLCEEDGTCYLRGPSIAVRQDSEDVYKYIAASVLGLFLSRNYQGVHIEYLEEEKVKESLDGTACLDLSDFPEEFNDFINSVIDINNNRGFLKSFLDILKAEIKSKEGTYLDGIELTKKLYDELAPKTAIDVTRELAKQGMYEEDTIPVPKKS